MEEFLQLDIFRPSIFDFAANLFVALGCGLFIAMVYRFTYRGASYSASFVNALVQVGKRKFARVTLAA